MPDKIIRKTFLNKRTKQLSVTIPKREVKAIDPSIKFGEEIFVELKILKKGRG